MTQSSLTSHLKFRIDADADANGAAGSSRSIALDPSDDALDGPEDVSLDAGAPRDAASQNTWNPPPEFRMAVGAPGKIDSAMQPASGANAAAAGAVTTQTVSTPGSGLVFINTYGSEDTQSFINDAVAAEQALEQHWITPITIYVTFDEAANGTTGANNYSATNNPASNVNVSYAQLTEALETHDFSPYPISLPSADPNPAGGDDWTLPEAYARMLGLPSTAPASDLSITLNTSFSWSYTQDVTNVLTHELTEGGMGRIGGFGDHNGIWSTMDLFTYSAVNTHDYKDGRDGSPTYFSNNGATLSTDTFNPDYNSNGVQISSGDTSDFTQQGDVFGVPTLGETYTLTPTDIEIMDVLGWIPTQEDFWYPSGYGLFTYVADWQYADGPGGYVPDNQDAFIGNAANNAWVWSDVNQVVNSIGTFSQSTLEIRSGSVFKATNGTVLNVNDVGGTRSGNFGAIEVDAGSTLALGNAFDNVGALDIGVNAGSSGGNGDLSVLGSLALSGGGAINLGQSSSTFQGFSTGAILGGNLVNADNDISGGGSIILAAFDNQVGGTVEASQEEGFNLQVSAAAWTNEGKMIADSRATLDLGQDGVTNSLINAGYINVASQGDLAISGDLTVSGPGDVGILGFGADITSDGTAPSTLTNASDIVATASGQIGDVGVFNSNDLTLANTGAVAVSGAGNTLTVNTGSNAVGNNGVFLADNEGTLLLVSTVYTGVSTRFPGLRAGIVEADSGGVVVIAGAVAGGPEFESLLRTGDDYIDGGTLELLSGASNAIPVTFKGTGGTLALQSGSNEYGQIFGVAASDSIEVPGTVTQQVVLGSNYFDITTDAGTYDFGDVGIVGALSGFISYFDASIGLEKVTFSNAKVAAAATATAETVLVDDALATISGGGNTIDCAAGTKNTLTLSDTGGSADQVIGSGETLNFNDAQVNVHGGQNLIDFTAGTENEVIVYDTNNAWDTVEGVSGIVGIDDAKAKLFGGGYTIITFGDAGNVARLYNTNDDFDAVQGSNGEFYLSSAQTDVDGGHDHIIFSGGSDNVASLSGTAGAADTVTGSNGVVDFNSAQATVAGSSDTVNIFGSSYANLIGTADTVTFSQGIGGHDRIRGFASTDVMQLSHVDFADFTALSHHLRQSGANAIIALNGSDTIELFGVTAANLTSSEFRFV